LSPADVPDALRVKVRAAAEDRCGYCQSRQEFVYGRFEIDHIVPRARGGTDDEDNLWLACRMCNGHKGAQTHGRDPVSGRRVPLFNPRRQRWSRHFAWTLDGLTIVGLTACGRATVVALRLNNPDAQQVRSRWVSVGWHPPGT
jgi:hypothetical protein